MFYEDETYIKMCEKAKEFIDYGAPTIAIPEGELMYYTHTHTLYISKNKRLFPLWRQDQLQAMIFKDMPVGGEDFLEYFINEIFDCESEIDEDAVQLGAMVLPTIKYSTDYWKNFNSQEQLWLAFVSQMHYKKTWDGEEWRDKSTKKGKEWQKKN